MVQKRVRGALGIAALSFVVGCNKSTPAEEQKPAEAVKQVTALDGINVVSTDEAGVATFVVGNLGPAPVVGAGSSKTSLASQKAALTQVVAGVSSTFQLAPENLQLVKAYTDPQGDSHFRYSVRHNGIPVLGGELRLHARNGQVFAANTNMRSNLKATTAATITSETAVAAVQADRETVAGAVTEPETSLVYWRDPEGRSDDLVLSYLVSQRGEKADGMPVHDLVLVNAESGDVFARLPQIHSALNRRMHNGGTLSTLPGPVARTEGQAPVADPVVNTNYDHLGTVYNCYSELFGRDSFNNAGAMLISTVHHRVRYVNAFWDGTQMVYGDGDGVTASNLANSLDVTAHELTHAVTDTESDLIYSGESGGLNESMSDIFGAVCEWYGAGRIVSDRIWLIGDDVWTPSTPNDALRYMANPTQDGSSLDYFPDYASGVDVHYSSGIPNLAFYLLSQGGTHPRAKTTQVVTGIGIERAARIWYKANVDILLPSSTMEQAKVATEQAAAQLGYDAATVTQVGNAWKAVGVGVPVVPPPTIPLEKDVTITGISDARNGKKYYSVNVPEGAYDLVFTLAGGTGDADMYVRFNNAPTTTSYDCRPFRSGNAESCPFAAPAHGTWYVMLNGFSAYTNTTLTVTWKGGYVPITGGVPVKPLSGAAGSSVVYTLVVPEYPVGSGTNSLFVQTGQGYGNPDIYVKRGGAPTKFDFDCRSVEEHMSETCELLNVPAGKYYIEVYGAKGGYEDIALIASFLHDW